MQEVTVRYKKMPAIVLKCAGHLSTLFPGSSCTLLNLIENCGLKITTKQERTRQNRFLRNLNSTNNHIAGFVLLDQENYGLSF